MNKQAFSLVEILVALIAVGCISAALAPVITKKLKSNGVSIGGGGIGGKTENVEFIMDCSDFGVDCTLCFNDKCVLCSKECNSDQYVNTPDCTCKACFNIDVNCIECTSKKCKKCAENYGLNLASGKCYLCTNGQSSDGMSECANCPENYFCVDGNKTPCATNQFAPVNSTSCTNCTDKWEHCAKCNPRECLECEPSYRKKEDGSCMLGVQSKYFTTPGNHAFQVPPNIKELTVTLVSGGAGGGAGSATSKSETFVISGNGGVSTNANNLVNVDADGQFSWAIPAPLKDTYALVSACGGGGGGCGSDSRNNLQGSGGKGGIISKVPFLMPNWDTIKINIGGGGGHGGTDQTSNAGNGGCSLGGGGAAGGNVRGTSCNATGNWGKGGTGDNNGPIQTGYGGYDPVYSEHGTGGGAKGLGTGSYGTHGAAGSKIGGGGGGGSIVSGGGGGGGATLFLHEEYANNANWVAGGGGGGGLMCTSVYGTGAGGGGGGGVTGGKGGSYNSQHGTGGVGYNSTNIFGSSYCNGGGVDTNGKNGAMKIEYIGSGTVGGTGGGAGQIVAEVTIAVEPEEHLIITVGEGASGGIRGHYNESGIMINPTNGNGNSESLVSKISTASGVVLLTTASNYSGYGTTGGSPDGTTTGKAGWITNGRSSAQITAQGFLSTDGGVSNGLIGGNGGSTTIEGAEMHCSPGTGGAVGVKGGDATGYGGCGGGGGGAGADGGKGAGGYVKITYGI